MRSRIGRRTAAFVLVNLMVVLVAFTANAAESMRFTVEPEAGSSDVHNGYFVFNSSPGAIVTGAITLRNISSASIDLSIAPVAALTALKGGVDYGLPANDSGIGSWLDLPSRTVHLEAQASRDVSFTVSVPEDARDGANLAGIAVWSPEDTPAPATGKRGNAFISVQTRRVIAVQVNLPSVGPPVLGVEGVEALALPDGAYLQMNIGNTGPKLTSGNGSVSIPDLSFTQDFDFGTFVPGTSMRYPLKLEGAPDDGEYPVSIHLDFEGGSADWSGTLLVGPALAAQLVDRGAVEAPKSFPFAIVLAVLALLAAGGVLARWFLRRREPSSYVPTAATMATARGTRAPLPPAVPWPSQNHRGRDRSVAPPPPPPLVRTTFSNISAAESR